MEDNKIGNVRNRFRVRAVPLCSQVSWGNDPAPFDGPRSPVVLPKMASVDHVIAAQIESIDKEDAQFVAIIDGRSSVV